MLDCIQSDSGRCRYHGTYFTPSLNNALGYASNSHGSEYISILFEMYSEVSRLAPGEVFKIMKPYPDVFECFQAKHQPIVIRWSDAPIKMLRVENDAPEFGVRDQLETMFECREKLRNTLSEEQIVDVIWAQDTFITDHVISFDHLVIEKI